MSNKYIKFFAHILITQTLSLVNIINVYVFKTHSINRLRTLKITKTIKLH